MTDTPEITITVHGAVGIGKSAVALAILHTLRSYGLECEWPDEREEIGMGTMAGDIPSIARKPRVHLVETNPSMVSLPLATGQLLELAAQWVADAKEELGDRQRPVPDLSRESLVASTLVDCAEALRKALGAPIVTGDGTGTALPPIDGQADHAAALDPKKMAAALLALSEALECPCELDDMLAQVDRLQRNAEDAEPLREQLELVRARATESLRLLWMLARFAGGGRGLVIDLGAMMAVDWSRAALARDDQLAGVNIRLRAVDNGSGVSEDAVRVFGVSTAPTKAATAVFEYIAARDAFETATRKPNSHGHPVRLPHGDPITLRYQRARAELSAYYPVDPDQRRG